MRPNYLVLAGILAVAGYFAIATLLGYFKQWPLAAPDCEEQYREYVRKCRPLYGEQRCRTDAYVLVCHAAVPKRELDALRID